MKKPNPDAGMHTLIPDHHHEAILAAEKDWTPEQHKRYYDTSRKVARRAGLTEEQIARAYPPHPGEKK